MKMGTRVLIFMIMFYGPLGPHFTGFWGPSYENGDPIHVDMYID